MLAVCGYLLMFYFSAFIFFLSQNYQYQNLSNRNNQTNQNWINLFNILLVWPKYIFLALFYSYQFEWCCYIHWNVVFFSFICVLVLEFQHISQNSWQSHSISAISITLLLFFLSLLCCFADLLNFCMLWRELVRLCVLATMKAEPLTHLIGYLYFKTQDEITKNRFIVSFEIINNSNQSHTIFRLNVRQ